ncbi:hypothetical protein NQ317_019737 [Molorchus minor]|uniref:Integrase catalytic domain-containing protein n=1 Tax=Molorchus minor TaxID=1323400 RepID=A0ABQ9IQZ1_9CUCU|nr:hypothetical protein NQ317_019737 [Molorchus minor]
MENSGNLEAKMLENCVNLEERRKESPACSVAGDKEQQHSIRHTTCETKMRGKLPQFDGKTPWPNYLRDSFNSSIKRRCRTDILQTLSSAEQADYEQLIKLFGDEAFLDGLRDGETRQALILARPTNLVDALNSEFWNFEAAKQCAKGKLESARRCNAEVWKSGAYKKTLPENQGRGYSNGAGKTNRVDDKGQPSIRDPHKPPKIAQVASPRAPVSTAFFIDALVDGKPRELLLDTDIEDELILGMDIMNTKGFKLDFKREYFTNKWKKKSFYVSRTEERVRVVLAEDGSHIRKFDECELSSCDTLKKGTVLGCCYPVASIVRSLGTTRENSSKFPAELGEALIKTSSRHLKGRTRGKMLRSLIEEFERFFDDGSGSRGRTQFSPTHDQHRRCTNWPDKLPEGCHWPNDKLHDGSNDYKEFDFITEHRAGTAHRNADALSRRPCPEDCKALENDPELKHIMTWKKEGRRPTWAEIARYSPVLKSYWAQWNSLDLNDGCLKRVLENGEGKEDQEANRSPQDKGTRVLREIHGGFRRAPWRNHGHCCKTERTFLLGERHKRCEGSWCRKCVECAASNGPQRRKKAPMRQYNVGSPFERIAIDVAGPFPESNDGNKYIVVVMDYFSKWVEAYALPNQEASTIADVLVKEWICRFGVPLELHSDQGRNFESILFQKVCQLLNIHKTRTTALHPQSDGMVERMNRTINRHLSKVVSNHQRDWDHFLPLFLLAYRSSVHETTGQTPVSIIMGRELRLPCDLKFGCPPGEDIAGEDYVTTLRRRMDDIHDQVRSNIQSASDRMKETYDIGAQNDGYQSGDLVWLYNPQRRRGLSPKLQTLWEGPYEVLARINDVVYRIKKSSGGKPRVVHFNRLTPFSGSNDASVRTVVPSTHEMSFENFMAQYSPNHKARYGVTREEQRDLFQVPAEFALAHCVAQDLQMSRGIAAAFKERGHETEAEEFSILTKHLSRDKPTYENVWESLISLRGALLSQDVTHLAIPKLSCGLDGLSGMVRNMLEVLFQFTGIEVLACSYHSGVPIAESNSGLLLLSTVTLQERLTLYLRRDSVTESASSVPSTALSSLTCTGA